MSGGSLSFEDVMRKLVIPIIFVFIFAVFLTISPAILLAYSKPHKIKIILNVVDDKDRAVKMQDDEMGKKMFDIFIEGDSNLAFLSDIGFKYIRSIIIDMSNDTHEKQQTIIVIASDGKIVVKKAALFNTPKGYVSIIKPARRYTLEASRFKGKDRDVSFYDMAFYPHGK